MPLFSVADLLASPPEAAHSLVSLVPSFSVTVAHLGAADRLAGLTKFCIHPSDLRREKCVIGGTKDLKLDKLLALQPAWVLASREENVREQVLALAEATNVLLTDVASLEDALQANEAIGFLCGRWENAREMNAHIRTNFSRLAPPLHRPKIAYFIWRKPWMVAGGDTFISSMMEAMGGKNVFDRVDRYPTIHPAKLPGNLDAVLLSSEPYPFAAKHVAELRQLLPNPNTKILLADGELFSWYGSKLLESPAYFAQLIQQIAL